MQNSAPVYSLADEAQARAESAAWQRFAAPADEAEFCLSWLALLCTRIERCRAALLLTGDGDNGPFRVSAVWPDRRRDLQYLGPTAQRALAERAGIVVTPEAGAPDAAPQVAYPVEVAGRLWGAVVLELGQSAEADLQRALRQIHWGIAWLVDHFRQRMLAESEATLGRVGLLNEVLATALSQRKLRPSALAVVNALAQRLNCERVSMGLERKGRIEPLVISNMATFDARSDLVRGLNAAMDEVLDLGVPLQFPEQDDEAIGALAHAELARERKLAALCSVPLTQEGQTIGALSFERSTGAPFDAASLALARTAGQMLGPVWALMREQEAGPLQRTWRWLGESVRTVFGPRHPGIKLLSVTALGLVAALALWTVDYRVSARTVVEGAQQVAAVAPFEGFVAAAPVRAGDSVRQGQLMAQLDDRDLKLEVSRWNAERVQLLRRFQVAQAGQDRGAMGVITAQVGQADAQLSLAQEKLARTTITAPFDGLVVSGDLSQQIGSPVEQGKVLFEVAPVSGYRVILQVDERDVARLNPGQAGELVLSGLPGEVLPFTVRQITPVSTPQDGRNFFRVEAELQGSAARLRPGLEGVGKVGVGREKLLWVWTHSFTDWLRLTLWNWMP